MLTCRMWQLRDPLSVLCLDVLHFSPSGQGAELCPPLGEGSSLLQFAFVFVLAHHPLQGEKKTARARIREPTKNYPPPKKKKPRTGPLHCKKKRKEKKGGVVESTLAFVPAFVLLCTALMIKTFLCMWNSLAFDSRTRIWFYARHHNFVGLTYFVFSVDLSFRADADWSSSCTEIAGLWTHVHSFPLAALDGCVGVAFLVLFGFFWFLRLYVYFLSPSLATAFTLSRAPAEEKNGGVDSPLYIVVYI